MPRTIDQMPKASENRWPPPGKHLATCIRAEKWISPNKKTPAVMLTWATPDGEYQWEDPIFVSAKAVSRLSLVASHVCAIPGNIQIPDDDAKAAGFLATYIIANAPNKQAVVTVIQIDEQYMPQTGPDAGRLKTVKRSRVAFAGYDAPASARAGGGNDEEPLPQDIPADEVPQDENIPF